MTSTGLSAVRAQTDRLFDLLHPAAMYERPIPERHRIIFYLGHFEAFDWNLLAPALGLAPVHPGFQRLFAFGIDPDSSGLPRDEPRDWPSVEEVRSFNTLLRARLDDALNRAPQHLLHVAIEHRLMHAETFAYMLHNLPFERKLGPPPRAPEETPSRDRTMVEVEAGITELGRESGDGFGWDNEFMKHEVPVSSFAIARQKVTNAEYLEFVHAGGPVPHFWRHHAAQWWYRGMFGEIPLPGSWPVYVTLEQACAYAAWRGKRLPTEAEFQRAAYPADPDPVQDNFDFQRWDPIPAFAGTPNARGLVQTVGNGWEWTSTVFGPFPGFETFPFYPNYSEPFFDGQHYVLKGASARTAARLTRPSFRNWFRSAYPYMYATFRLAENA